MIKVLLVIAVLAAPARAQFRDFNPSAEEPEPLNFCAKGRFIIAAGSCSPSKKHKAAISPKACTDAASTLYDGLRYLYPNASVEYYEDLAPEEIMSRLMRPLVKGFFFVGEGDVKGGFVTGEKRGRLYPDIGGCTSGAIEVLGGFTSHSKYSPASPARKADTGKVISRMELVYDGKKAPAGSWARLCKPRFALAYPTRTFAGRMKDDAKKLLGVLMDEKKRHVLKTLSVICANCPGHVAAGTQLARLCPPNSEVCRAGRILPGTEKLVLDNYCAALAPTASRAEE